MFQAFFAPVMKMNLAALSLSWLLLSCGGKQAGRQQKEDCSDLPVNTLLADDSMKVSEERLNDFSFSVRLLATGQKGKYDVHATYGPNDGNGRMVMPRGGESLCPELRRGPEPYSFEIGFRQDKDTTFYPYYLVSWDAGQIMMRYTTAYSFE